LNRSQAARWAAILRDGDPSAAMQLMKPAEQEGWLHLIVRRRDGKDGITWDQLQHAKNKIVGAEHEGVELYPAESRLLNLRNARHLWVFADVQERLHLGFHAGRNAG
jgi:hypothetical protein